MKAFRNYWLLVILLLLLTRFRLASFQKRDIFLKIFTIGNARNKHFVRYIILTCFSRAIRGSPKSFGWCTIQYITLITNFVHFKKNSRMKFCLFSILNEAWIRWSKQFARKFGEKCKALRKPHIIVHMRTVWRSVQINIQYANLRMSVKKPIFKTYFVDIQNKDY